MDSGLYSGGVRSFDARLGPAEAPPCPACGADGARPRMTFENLEGHPLLVCEPCGLGFVHPLPEPERIRSFYPPSYFGDLGTKFEPKVEAWVRLIARRHVRFLSRRVPPGGRILDVGCGRGVVLSALADRGFEVHGFEQSEAAVQGVDPRAKIRVADCLADAAYPDASFDQVLLWHVLEHLADPAGTLEEIRRILRPGGHLVVAVPNFGSLQARWAGPAWFHLDPPRHLYHFTPAALGQMLSRCGFDIRSTHHFSLRQNPFGWVQSALNRSARLPRNGLYVLLHRSPQAEQAYDAATRRRLRWAYWLGMPVGLALSIGAALVRSGATMHVVAERSED